ncbi:lipid-binding SYLF domain-containing protein [Aminomonas paucivorans]|uniref:lipid-binding SYLF domain-containing protein n=1 Tax=Aminomonas paucivorans TaxID=81412 RepID=UPI003316855F
MNATRLCRTTRPFLSLALALCLLALGAAVALASSPQERIRDCTKVLREMAKENDSGAMADLIRSAKGVAIFPSVVKAGLVFGGKYGEGLILRRDPGTGRWFGPSFLNVAGASWGLQIGVQSTALVLVITNDRGMEGFVGDKVTLGGDLSVAAGPVGRNAEAGTDSSLTASIYSYSMSKGLFAGLSLEGAVVSTEYDTNRSYWKKDLDSRRVLNTRATKDAIQPLIQELNRQIKRSRQ